MPHFAATFLTMPGKRLAILGSRGIPARYGGFETFAEELSVRLAAMGTDVTVYCEAGEQQDAPKEYRGVRLQYVAATRLGPLTTIVFDLKCLWHARNRADVVYMLGYGASIFCLLPRMFGAVVWINMDGVEWWRSKWNAAARTWLRLMERIATRTANLLVADADAIREHLRARYRTLPETVVIPYGAPVVEAPPDAALLGEFGVDPDNYYLVVCRIEPENHVVEIVEGFVGGSSELPLVVVGDTQAESAYAGTVRSAGDDRVRCPGTVFDRDKLNALRWHCRAYFHGHSVGGTNPSLLEALGCGNRVVAHDNVFNREVAGDCAVYFSKADEIPRLVEQLDAAPTRDKHRRRSQQRIVEHYDWDAIAVDYQALLDSGR